MGSGDLAPSEDIRLNSHFLTISVDSGESSSLVRRSREEKWVWGAAGFFIGRKEAQGARKEGQEVPWGVLSFLRLRAL